MNRRHFLVLAGSALAATTSSSPSAPFPFPRSRGKAGLEARAEANDHTSTALDDPAHFHAIRQYVHTRFGDIAYIDRGTGPAALCDSSYASHDH